MKYINGHLSAGCLSKIKPLNGPYISKFQHICYVSDKIYSFPLTLMFDESI